MLGYERGFDVTLWFETKQRPQAPFFIESKAKKGFLSKQINGFHFSLVLKQYSIVNLNAC